MKENRVRKRESKREEDVYTALQDKRGSEHTTKSEVN